MSEFKIEKGIPTPSTNAAYKYPFHEMEVGDSFYVPQQDATGSASTSAYGYGLRHNMKFSARTVDGGVRIWRIK